MSRLEVEHQLDSHLIAKLKTDPNALRAFINQNKDSAVLLLLEKFGRLKDNKPQDALIKLLDSGNEKIRILAIKNLAKIGNPQLIPFFVIYGKNDPSTNVRREAVSALGRMNNTKAIPELIKFLTDDDPKVVMQAIRGLLPFVANSRVKNALLSMANHPNELIQEIINTKLKSSGSRSDNTYVGKDFGYLHNKVILGDVLDTLKYIPKESVDLSFTSPPYYNARDYSIYQSYTEYLKLMEKIFKGVHKITKEGRFFVLNTSPVIVPRISRAYSSKRYPIPFDLHPLLIKMGWEFIDDIIWLKPEASVKNRNAGFYQHRKPLGYKPNAITEMLMVYRKKTDKLIDWNMRHYDNRTVAKSKVKEDYETTNVWQIAPTFDKNHSAVFPDELCRRVISFYSYVGDLVFDPFGGSGTLGFVAAQLERKFILAEKDPGYFASIKKGWDKRNSLFNANDVGFLNVKDFRQLRKNLNAKNK